MIIGLWILKKLSRFNDMMTALFSQRWSLGIILLGIGIAIGFFDYGIHVPFKFRLRGDAWDYMGIASQFTSFHDALYYAGIRSPGFPWFDYFFLTLDTSSSIVSKVNHICLTLFILHELTSLWICFICVKCRLFPASSTYLGLLFLVLSTYPPMVMHTTTPLTDVFGVDLLLIGFSLFAWDSYPSTNPCKRVLVSLFLGMSSGLLLGYAILVRPAYWIGVVGFLVTYMLMIIVNRVMLPNPNRRQPFRMWMVTILTLAAVIFPVVDHCKARYHTVCLQDPLTFDAMLSVSTGLSSARTVWNRPEGEIPHYPDAFLVKNFYNRCPITSVMGRLNNDNTNLLSCLFHAPHLATVYFAKKLIGLFDPFRMTPYTEQLTPVWYIWIARAFSSVAFVGFWILLIEGIKRAYQWLVHRKPVSSLIAATWVFGMIQVSVHSILHVEERYALPWIPLCILAVFLKIKAIQEQDDSTRLGWMWLIFAVLLIAGYFIQVLAWDDGMT